MGHMRDGCTRARWSAHRAAYFSALPRRGSSRRVAADSLIDGAPSHTLAFSCDWVAYLLLERRRAVPISFSIEPSTGLLRTVVTGRFSRDEVVFYATELRGHPELSRVERRLVDVRPSAVVTADEILDLLLIEHDMAGSVRRTDRRAILLNSDNGPALGRELVVSDRRHSGIPVAYRVFRTSAHAYRYLRVDPRLTSERLRNAGRV